MSQLSDQIHQCNPNPLNFQGLGKNGSSLPTDDGDPLGSCQEKREEGQAEQAGQQAQLPAAQDQRGQDRQAGGGGQGGGPLQDGPDHQHNETFA